MRLFTFRYLTVLGKYLMVCIQKVVLDICIQKYRDLEPPYLLELSVMIDIFYICANIVATRQVWFLFILNVSSVTEEPNFNFYLI